MRVVGLQGLVVPEDTDPEVHHLTSEDHHHVGSALEALLLILALEVHPEDSDHVVRHLWIWIGFHLDIVDLGVLLMMARLIADGGHEMTVRPQVDGDHMIMDLRIDGVHQEADLEGTEVHLEITGDMMMNADQVLVMINRPVSWTST